MLADPRRLGEEAKDHARQCAACDEFREQELEIENQLEEALRVPLPEGLVERILGKSVKTQRPARRLALAASLLLAAGIGFWASSPHRDPLALAGIEFVMFDEAQSIVDAKPTEWKELLRVAAQMGVSLPGQLGEIRYICVYPLAAGPAHHLLVKTPYGKITVLLIAERPPGKRAAESVYGLEAVVRPARAGNVVIVGDSTRSLRRAESILWNG